MFNVIFLLFSNFLKSYIVRLFSLHIFYRFAHVRRPADLLAFTRYVLNPRYIELFIANKDIE